MHEQAKMFTVFVMGMLNEYFNSKQVEDKILEIKKSALYIEKKSLGPVGYF